MAYADVQESLRYLRSINLGAEETFANGLLHLLTNQLEASLKLFSKGSDNPVVSCKAEFGKALAYVKLKQWPNVTQCCQSAIRISSEFALPHVLKGAVEFFTGKSLKAIETWKLGQQACPSNPSFHDWMACVLLQYGKPERAYRLAVLATELDEEDVCARLTAAWAAFRMDHFDIADRAVQTALELRPKSQTALLLAGILAMKANKLERACEYFTQCLGSTTAVDSDPLPDSLTYPPLRPLSLGSKLKERKEPHDMGGMQEFGTALELSAVQEKALALRAAAYVSLGKPNEALKDCTKFRGIYAKAQWRKDLLKSYLSRKKGASKRVKAVSVMESAALLSTAGGGDEEGHDTEKETKEEPDKGESVEGKKEGREKAGDREADKGGLPGAGEYHGGSGIGQADSIARAFISTSAWQSAVEAAIATPDLGFAVAIGMYALVLQLNAELLAAVKRYEEAVALCTEFLVVHPPTRDILVLRTLSNWYLRRTEHALFDAQKLTALYPEDSTLDRLRHSLMKETVLS